LDEYSVQNSSAAAAAAAEPLTNYMQFQGQAGCFLENSSSD